MMYNIEHFFIYLFSEVSYSDLLPILSEWFIFLLYISDTSFSSDNVFFKYFLLVVCFVILLTVSFAKQKSLILMKANLPVFLSWIVLLVLYLQSHCQTQCHLDFPLWFFQKFCILCFMLYVYDPFWVNFLWKVQGLCLGSFIFLLI